jgi:hypothetical protein
MRIQYTRRNRVSYGANWCSMFRYILLNENFNKQYLIALTSSGYRIFKTCHPSESKS